MKILNNIFNIILWVGIPYILVTIATEKYGIGMGISVMILVLVALFLRFKPSIYTIMGKRKYFKDHDEGFKWLQKAYDTGKMVPQQSLIYAYLLIRDGHIAKAERLINSVLLNKKDMLTKQNLLAADLNMAIIMWKKGDLKGAVEKMEYVYSTGYRSTVHYGTLGIFYILNNQLDRALEFCLEAVEYNPSDASIRDNLGLVYFRKGEIDKAEEIYRKLFEDTNPEFIEAYYNYGMVLEKKGDLTAAAGYYRTALGCPEKFLSTVKLGQADAALSRVEQNL